MAKKRTTVKPFSNDAVYQDIKTLVDDAVKVQTRDVFTKLIRGGLSRDELISSVSSISGNAFARASTVVDTGLSVVGRERINEVAQELGLEWFRYIGGTIATSRDFCIERDGGYYSKEEVEEWADEDWEGKIDGTNSETIFSYCGGYNCRHELIPVLASSVPSDVKKFNEEEQRQSRSDAARLEALIDEPVIVEDAGELLPSSLSATEKSAVTQLRENIESEETSPVVTNALPPAEREYLLQGFGEARTDGEEIVRRYTNSGHQNYNAVARGTVDARTGGRMFQDHAQSVNKMDSYVNANKSVISEPFIYRGVGDAAYLKGVKVGDTIVDQGFVSTTRSVEVAQARATLDPGGASFVIDTKGLKGIDVNRLNLTDLRNEKEIILPRNVKFVVSEIRVGFGGITEYVLKLK